MALTITSISPSTIPPGATVTITGTGFDAGSRACLPVAVATEYVSPTQLTAVVPADLKGVGGGQVQIGAFVMGADAAISNVVLLTVVFPPVSLQGWTTVESVCGEVPGFERGGRIPDKKIREWIESYAQSIKGVLMKRGFSLNPASWAAASSTDGTPSAVDVLETINRLGAASRLASAVTSLFQSQDTALVKNLSTAFKDELVRLEGGAYDVLFNPAAATELTGPAFAGGDVTDSSGGSTTLFPKDKVF